MSRSRVLVTSNRRRPLRPGTGGRAQERLRRRRVLAGAAAALWMLGFELVPGLHMAVHDRLASHDHADSHGHALHTGPGHDRPGHHGRDRRDDRDHAHGHDHADGQPADHGHGVDHGHELAANAAPAGLATHPAPFDALSRPRAPDRDHDPGHGAGSLAHRGLAAVDPPPPARLPDILPAATSPRPLEPTDVPRPTGPLVVRGRGPPRAS